MPITTSQIRKRLNQVRKRLNQAVDAFSYERFIKASPASQENPHGPAADKSATQPPQESVNPSNQYPTRHTPKEQRSREWMSAVIGLVGALLGSGLTFAGIVYQSNENSNAQTVADHRTLYANYYTALENSIEYATGTMLYLKIGYPEATWENEDSQYRTYGKQYGSLEVQMLLLSSPDVAANVQEQNGCFTRMNSWLDTLEGRVEFPDLPVTTLIPIKSVAVTQLSASISSCTAEAKQFLAVARPGL
jgi:hypothetical protein